ncbi:TIGR03643 family protein [Maribrevibacterium harenarium]|uniref:TIGR03643 family protein n=1 Tax=Maribrevibacterium harenarium TaxID=2589817 RepID=A0A501WFP3_9GAMM|nr:TIGR03643 family protein [Maribrevibacterium harenarium]TPE48228.1 TIGR03643 family protein [Maribrevibacterium harenarium]
MNNEEVLTPADISRIVEMAWEDRTPFEAIEHQFGLTEAQTIKVMQRHMQPRSFRLWRARVNGRKTKHLQQRSESVIRGYSPGQYKQRHGRK